MKRYMARRLLQSLAVLLGVSMVVFLLLHLSGDPASIMLHQDATQEELEQLRLDLGLNDALTVQYSRFLGRAIKGDFGQSLRGHQPAMNLVLERLPATALLASTALSLALLIAFPLGIFAAVKRHTFLDQGSMFFALFGQAMPNFWLGLMLILIFSVHLRWLPTGGSGGIQHLILPTITLGLHAAARTARLVRSGMLEVLTEDFVRTAHAKGLSAISVILRHGLRNALIPVVTVIGLDMATLLGGSVITETIFGWPGVGRLVIQSILSRDFPVVQAAVFVIACLYVVLNLIVDVMYTYLDPRVRLS